MKRFKKGTLTREAFSILMFDLGLIDARNDSRDALERVKGNLQDIFGMRKTEDELGD